jgi:septal ring factor EnvC (AmiA/AmiB activator)
MTMEIWKKYRKWILLAGGIVLVSFVSFRACDLTDRLSVLTGEYRAALDHSKVQTKTVEKENAKLAGDIKAQDAKIVKLEADVKAKTQNISHLTNSIADLNEDLAVAQTDRERVVILTTLVENYKEKCAVYEAIISDKDAEIGAYRVKFGDMEKIALNYKGLLDSALDREEILNKTVSSLKLHLRVSKLGGTVKTGLVLSAVAYLVYCEVKK